jgi:hypothetical protein
VSVLALGIGPRDLSLLFGIYQVLTGSRVFCQLHHDSAGEEGEFSILLVENQKWNQVILKELPVTKYILSNWIKVAIILDASVQAIETRFAIFVFDVDIVPVDFFDGAHALDVKQ